MSLSRYAEPAPQPAPQHSRRRLIRLDARIRIQRVNPKKPGTKSADLYDLYKGASSVREMLSLGGRRGDVSYDISHGWIEFENPGLQLRFTGAPVAPEPTPAPAPAPGERLIASRTYLGVQLPAADSSADSDQHAANAIYEGDDAESRDLDPTVPQEPAQLHPFDC